MIHLPLFAVAVALIPLDAAAVEPYDAVSGSPHNFFVRSEFPVGNRLCYGCHTEGPGRAGSPAPAPGVAGAPPDAAAADDVAPPSDVETAPPPLWQRGAKAYTVPPIAGGSSTACLGCHDGVLGQEVHRIGDPEAPVFDHPYDVVYPRRANGRFVPERPTVNQYRYWSIPDLHNGELILPTGPTSSLLTASVGTEARVVRTLEGLVQCDSCHDPHDNGSAPFLRAPAQDLCLICHDR